jgi:predicted nucleotidyltransferase
MLKKESELLYLFAVKPWQAYLESELKALYGTNSRSYTRSFLEKYVSEGIIKTEHVGKFTTYKLDLGSLKARAYAGAVLELHGWKSKVPDMRKLIEKMPYASYTMLITGSYAKGSQHSKSDLDVVIIIEDACEPKKVRAELRLESELSIPHVHLYVFRNSEFIEMLRNQEANYGKEIIKNFLILSQGQTFLKLVYEAMKNGFNGTDLSPQGRK